MNHPTWTYGAFLDYFLGSALFLGHNFYDQDLWDNVSLHCPPKFGAAYQLSSLQINHIQSCLEDLENADVLRNSPLLRHILRKAAPTTSTSAKPRHVIHQVNHHPPLQPKGILGNPDLAVLRPENQSSTHVTPRIGAMARGYFKGDLIVVGPPPKLIDNDLVERNQRRLFVRVQNMLAMANTAKRKIAFPREHLTERGSRWANAVEIDGIVYRVSSVSNCISCTSYTVSRSDKMLSSQKERKN